MINKDYRHTPIQRKVGYGQTESTHFIGPSGYAGGPITIELLVFHTDYLKQINKTFPMHSNHPTRNTKILVLFAMHKKQELMNKWTPGYCCNFLPKIIEEKHIYI